MKFVAILRKHYSLHVILPVAALLCGCGGSPLEDDTMLPPTQLDAAPAQSSSVPRLRGQGEFNRDIWDQHRWYECDCGRNSTAPIPG